MKTYTEMINEIDLLLNSKESLDIYKEQCELEILSDFINNKLYLREYTDNILNELKINVILEAANTKQQAWYKKALEYSNTIVDNLWKLISGIFTWVINSCKTLINFVSKQNVSSVLKSARDAIFGNKPEEIKNESFNFNLNTDLYITEDGHQLLAEIQKRFLKSYNRYKKIYEDFSKNKLKKINLNNLKIIINDVNINEVFNETTVSTNSIQSLIKKDEFTFYYEWNSSDPNDKFEMMSIESFNDLTKNFIDEIIQRRKEFDNGIKNYDNIIAKLEMTLAQYGNNPSVIPSNADTTKLGIDLFSMIGTATILPLLPMIGINIFNIVPPQYTSYAIKGTSIGLKYLLSSIGKFCKNLLNKLNGTEIKSNITFTISHLINSISNDATRFNSILYNEIKNNTDEITNYFTRHKRLLENISKSIMSKTTISKNITNVHDTLAISSYSFNFLNNLNNSAHILHKLQIFLKLILI